MKTIKTLIKLLLSVMIMITSLSVTALPVKAEPTDGTAYAVLTDEGDLIFFRSYETYTNEDETTVTDINDNQFTGTVFANVENNNTSQNSWSSYTTTIKTVSVADNTIIQPNYTRYMFNGCSSLTSIDLRGFDTSNVTNMEQMFASCSALTKLNLSGLDTSNVTNMRNMFSNCSSLTNLDLSGLDTSNVTNMLSIFYGCSALTSLNLNGLDTSKLESMSGMFFNCSSLTNLDLSGLNTSNVTSMATMFYNCSSLANVNLSGLDTSNVTSMGAMFFNCSALTNLNLSGVNTSSVTDMSDMFSGCSSLTSLDLYSFNTSNVVNMDSMFLNCDSLVEIKLGQDFTNWNNEAYLPIGNWTNGQIVKTSEYLYNQYPDNAEDWAGLWNKITQPIESISLDKSSVSLNVGETETLVVTVLPENATLRKVDWSSSDESIATVDDNGLVTAIASGTTVISAETKDGSNLSANCDVSVNQSTADPNSGTAYAILTDEGDLIFFRSNEYYTNKANTTVTDINNKQYTGIVLSGVENTGSSFYSRPWYDYCLEIKKVFVTDKTIIHPLSTSSWFNGCKNLQSFVSKGFDTSQVSSMRGMFWDCYSLINLNLDSFDTNNVTDMGYMFCCCNSLKNINLSGFDTHNVTDMTSMFEGCSSLLELDLSNFDTTNVLSMGFKASSPYGGGSGGGMFHDCSSLVSINLGNFDTKNVTTMGSMFGGCSSLTEIDLSSFDTHQVTDMWGMFSGCKSLTFLDFSNMDTSNVINMSCLFSDCNSLERIDLSHIDTSSVTSMNGMFSGCSSLTSLDLSSFDTSNVIYMGSMFYDCDMLQNVKLGDKFTKWIDDSYLPTGTWKNGNYQFSETELYTNYPQLSDLLQGIWIREFIYITELYLERIAPMYPGKSINISTTINPNNASYTDLTWYSNNEEVAIVDQYGNVTAVSVGETTITATTKDGSNISDSIIVRVMDSYAYAVLDNDGNLTFVRSKLYYDAGNDKSVIDINGDIYTGTVFTSIENTGNNYSAAPWYNSRDLIKSVCVAANTSVFPISMRYWFVNCSNLISFDGDGIDTNNIKNMQCMFGGCHNLVNLSIGKLITSSVTSMRGMFESCFSLTSLDLSNFDTSSVEDMYGMFMSCGVKILDISSFDTSNVTEMSGMFQGCNNLTSIKLGTRFTKWISNAYLTSGYWTNGDISLRCADLYNQYPSNAENWAGIWYRITQNVNSISLTETNIGLVVGETKMLIASVLPDNATLKTVEWSSEDEEIVTVDEYGIITAVSPGETIIEVHAKDGGGASATCTVRVHEYVFNDIIFNDDYTAFGLYIDAYDGEKYIVEADVTSEIAGLPTCTETGQTLYIATITSNNSLDKKEHIGTMYEDIDPIGHDWEYTGIIWDGIESAVANYVCLNDDTHTETVEAQITVQETAPRCEESGFFIYTATVNDEHSLDWESHTDKKEVEISATGHTPSVPVRENEQGTSCTESGSYEEVIYCSVCGKELSRETITVEVLGHNFGEWEVTTEPTCTDEGFEVRHCSRCDETETKIIPATGHNLFKVEKVEPDCENKGVIGHYECFACGKLFEDADGNKEITAESTVIAALGHDIEIVNSIPATCTETGIKEHWHCLRCGKLFSDGIGTEEISSDEIIIPANGHTTGETTHENEVYATCTEEGSYDEVVRCTVCNEVLSSEHIIVEALRHNWGETVQSQAPTCTENGIGERECLRCHEHETVEIPALGHDFGNGIVINNPSSSGTGTIEYTCPICGETKQEVLPAGQVIDMNIGEEANYEISFTQNYYISINSLTPEIANANVSSMKKSTVSVGNISYSTYTIGMKILGDSTGMGVIVLKWGNNSVKYIYPNVTVGTQTVEGCADELEIKLISYNELNYNISNPDIKFTVDKKKVAGNFTVESNTYATSYFINTFTLSFDKPIKDDHVVISSELGDAHYLNLNVTQHEWNDPVYEWSYDNKTVTATRICKKNESHVKTETVETTAIVVEQPSCTENGQTKYVADFNDKVFTTQIKTEADIPAFGHDWIEIRRTEPTYYEEGKITYKCQNCGEESIDYLGALPINAPQLTKIENTPYGAYLEWTPVEYASYYDVWFSLYDSETNTSSTWFYCADNPYLDLVCPSLSDGLTLTIRAYGYSGQSSDSSPFYFKHEPFYGPYHDKYDYNDEIIQWFDNDQPVNHYGIEQYKDYYYYFVNYETGNTYGYRIKQTPNLIRANQLDNGLEILWEMVDDVYNYIIYRRTDDSDWEKLAITWANGSYIDTEIEPNKKYYYTVACCDYNDTQSSFYDVNGLAAIYKVAVTSPTRIAGANRFGTSQDIALMFKQNNNVEKLDAVILANGDNFADALAGSYLAAVKNAPIIITRAGKESEINDYIRSILNKNGTIYVLGGTAAVPESCLNGLTGKGYDIERIAGNNRYLTNLAILDKAGVSGDTLLIATGTNYADSLSASATGLPMLLVKDSLSDEQRSFLREHRGMKLIILGGTNAVNSTVESQLGGYGEVSRISGANRAGTSLEIAKKFFPEATTAVIAYSHNFPDGLCGGPLANQINSPLILTRDNDADATASYMKSKGIKTGYVLGGTSVLTDSLVRKLYAMRSSDKIIEFNK